MLLSYKRLGNANVVIGLAMNVRLLLMTFLVSLLLASTTEGFSKRHAEAYQKRFLGFLSEDSKTKLKDVVEEAVRSMLSYFWSWFK